MALLELLLLLLLSSVALGWIARRFKFPYPIALVAAGPRWGWCPTCRNTRSTPQLILVAVLPPILYQAALLTSWTDFKANIRPIGLLAIGLVAVTTLAVGATLKLMVPDVPWAAAVRAGCHRLAARRVAATAILSRLNMPRRIVTILEGESLVNDATGLVLYKFAVAAVLTGRFSFMDATVQFALVSAGGIAVGVVLAFAYIASTSGWATPSSRCSRPHHSLRRLPGGRIRACSGVLAVVAAGWCAAGYCTEIVSRECASWRARCGTCSCSCSTAWCSR
jgi:CPA1 family monovalent cation:H+ antiporter